MPIPFIRMMPNGRRVAQQVEREPEIENLARAFIARGGRYLIEIRKDLKVHLTAIIDLPGGLEKVADASCANGPDLLDTIDALVRRSISNTPAPPSVDILQLRKPGIIMPGHA